VDGSHLQAANCRRKRHVVYNLPPPQAGTPQLVTCVRSAATKSERSHIGKPTQVETRCWVTSDNHSSFGRTRPKRLSAKHDLYPDCE